MPLITRKELDQIKKIKGHTIGDGLSKDREFVLKEKGKKGLKKAEDKMEELGHPVKYKEIDRNKRYPAATDILFLLVCKRMFKWNDDKIREWGQWGVKVHFITKMMMKYFTSLEVLAKQANRYWSMYYDEGEMKMEQIDKKEKNIILSFQGFKTHPVHLRYIEGVIHQAVSFVVRSDKLQVRVSPNKKEDYRINITW